MSTTATKERPIIFSGPMIRAIIEGCKTQTRRAMKSKWFELCEKYDHLRYNEFNYHKAEGGRYESGSGPFDPSNQDHQRHACSFNPYGQVGERLWVREAWRLENDTNPNGLTVSKYVTADSRDHWRVAPKEFLQSYKGELRGRTNSPIHMPRWASRLTLEITDVRVQRLNSISGADAEAEGIPTHVAEYTFRKCYRDVNERESKRLEYFRDTWEKINGKNHPWEANPWVWAITFKAVKP